MGRIARPHSQWSDATVLRMGVRPHRPREHDVYRFLPGGDRHLCALSLGERPGLIYLANRPRVLCLGRDLLTISIDMYGYIRRGIRNYERRPTLHRKGN